MNTVFSHIVQKRLSPEYENIATEALAFILHSNESARSGLMKFLRGIASDLPSLQFRTQQTDGSARPDQTDGSARPDMCGFEGTKVRVFIENKFWAGLTVKQPVEYLERLAKCTQPSLLLVVVPTARQETMWRELCRRIEEAKVSTPRGEAAVGGVRSAAIGRGRILALTSWKTLLDAIETELTDEPQAKNDLLQLRGLCDAANQAFEPISPEQVTNQRTPSFFLQLSSIVQRAVDEADGKGVLSKKSMSKKNPRKSNLLPTHSWDRVGRYICFPGASGVGAWFGTEFTLWKEHGSTPLWLVFSKEWGRATEVQAVLEPWASRKRAPTVWRNDKFAIGIELATGEEETAVITSVVNRLKEIAKVLSKIGRKRK